jgi:hypothetical protein
VQLKVRSMCLNAPFGALGHLSAASRSVPTQVLAQSHTPKYLFLNIAKCSVHTFFVDISLMCVQASPMHHLTKSRFCVILLEALDNAQSHVIFLKPCNSI